MPAYIIYVTKTVEQAYRIEAADPDEAMATAQQETRDALIGEHCSDSIKWEAPSREPTQESRPTPHEPTQESRSLGLALRGPTPSRTAATAAAAQATATRASPGALLRTPEP